MRRMGKVVWVLIYICFVPLLAMRYTALMLSAIVKDLLYTNDIDI